MDEQLGEIADSTKLSRLALLEATIGKNEPWTHEDQAWLVAELRKAWAQLAEAGVWIPVDPSRIG